METKVTEPVKDAVVPVSMEEFIKGIEVKARNLEVPEFGAGKGVRIQPITLDARQKMRSACRKTDGTLDEDLFQVFTVVFGVVEPKLSHEQVVAIRTGNPAVVDRISKAIWSESGMGLEAAAVKKRLKGDVVERNLYTLARDLNRLPSELMSQGRTKHRFSLRAPGWLGKFLRFDGELEDGRQPVMMDEFVTLQGLYLLEAEEEAEAMEKAKRGG